MRPIIVPLTHKKVRPDPILGRDPWFGNPGLKGFESFESEPQDLLLH